MAKKKPESKLAHDIVNSFNQSLTLIEEHHYTIERLAKDLKRFEGEVDRQLEAGSQVMTSQVQRLVAAAREFLSVCRRDGRAPFVPHCLAAIDYLVNSEDAVPDFEHYDGFEDDMAVFQHVIDRFDLKVKIGSKAA